MTKETTFQETIKNGVKTILGEYTQPYINGDDKTTSFVKTIFIDEDELYICYNNLAYNLGLTLEETKEVWKPYTFDHSHKTQGVNSFNSDMGKYQYTIHETISPIIAFINSENDVLFVTSNNEDLYDYIRFYYTVLSEEFGGMFRHEFDYLSKDDYYIEDVCFEFFQEVVPYLIPKITTLDEDDERSIYLLLKNPFKKVDTENYCVKNLCRTKLDRDNYELTYFTQNGEVIKI